uniref:dihydrolipoyllysine-residue succinyltransferase n=1 Tax=Chromera velia CCMP2878 TaxID=1169474 RepID=A0A0G4HLM7_9ALVE|mmetsp:Transcript_24555/g.48178  ORF Transcript_24555/g.48178 Transcript_24555/m.48178 type:complete len:452 (+) Transcript_24555:323-1678(+)|eukprot:Cvel_1149.t1-p1 / transcript=Cvel_1149.t1 / gene=Cvel_1149 / organism=Chromera_velia_CCMP2878 / gene_product=Dihydrolipoyllysine-residue succinyltransferase, putative / transcript_product=Dihydrolipoyllysine-residue succinyltransferase, putative / location=Cvel_scaffold38:30240-36807(-) / protein_length=451 / sequence_SO=supercontig / SO=protein_coding / is_pseudo=false
MTRVLSTLLSRASSSLSARSNVLCCCSVTATRRFSSASRHWRGQTGRHLCSVQSLSLQSGGAFSPLNTHPAYVQAITGRRFFSDAAEMVVPVPSMGDSITEGSINVWKKQVGDFVAKDEVVAVIDTDKVSVDVNSPESGIVVAHAAAEGDTVEVAAPLFTLKPGAAPEGGAPPPPADTPKEAPKSDAPKEEKAPPPPAPAAPAPPKPAAAAPAASGTDARGEKRVPMSRMRLRIAERLKGAQNTAAMLTTFQECDMGDLMALRSEINEAFLAKHGVKLGFMSAFLRASTLSLMKMPELNAFIEDKTIIYKDYIDIGVAVATPTGLTVPVVRDCQKKSVSDLEIELGNIAKKARNNQIALEDMIGGCFTISNGGVYGSMLGTPILNPPQASILGMHAIVNRPVVKGKEIVIRPIMYLALTYDHRLVDGREGVTFLKSIKEYIEDPRKMLLDL